MTDNTPGPSNTPDVYNTSRAVALYNAKGGTGKTTIGINVAGALAQRGLDVCFLDLDPQGNATEGLGLVEEYDAEPPNLFDVVAGHEPPETIRDLAKEQTEMDVIPSNVDMLNAERDLVIADYEGEDSLAFFNDAIRALESDYDIVLIDSPPFFGQLTDAALYASQNVLIPALTESTSERAVELLLEQLEDLEAERDIYVRELGAVANRIETTNEAERMQEWLERAFPDVPVWRVRKRVALQRAHTAGVSIFEYDSTCDMAGVFEEIADSIAKQLDLEVVTDG